MDRPDPGARFDPEKLSHEQQIVYYFVFHFTLSPPPLYSSTSFFVIVIRAFRNRRSKVDLRARVGSIMVHGRFNGYYLN